MVIPLGRPLPDASRNPPGRQRGSAPGRLPAHAVPIRFCSRWGLPCRPCRQGRGALLPHPFTLTETPSSEDQGASAVCSLWHFPWGRPRRTLSGTVLPWSPDFPPPRGFPHCAGATIQPSGAGVLGVALIKCNSSGGFLADQRAQGSHAWFIRPAAQAAGAPVTLERDQGHFGLFIP